MKYICGLLCACGLVFINPAQSFAEIWLVGDYAGDRYCQYHSVQSERVVELCHETGSLARLVFKANGIAEVNLPHGDRAPEMPNEIVWLPDHPDAANLIARYQAMAALCQADENCAVGRPDMGVFASASGCQGQVEFGELRSVFEYDGLRVYFGTRGFVWVCVQGVQIEMIHHGLLGGDISNREPRVLDEIQHFTFRPAPKP